MQNRLQNVKCLWCVRSNIFANILRVSSFTVLFKSIQKCTNFIKIQVFLSVLFENVRENPTRDHNFTRIL